MLTHPSRAEPAAGPDPTGARPRPLFSPTRHLHTDRRVADDVRHGVFDVAGVRLALGHGAERGTDLGAPDAPHGPVVDWFDARLPADEEWRIEWSKFAWGLDLAHAFATSGDPGYLRVWERLVGSWVDQVPVDHDPTDVVARRLQHWVFAWADLEEAAVARGTDGPSEATRAVLVASVAAQLDHLEANVAPERNHRTLELFAVLAVCLALPALDPDGRRARRALDALGRNLLDDVRVDGVQRERSTHYHCVALRSWVAAVVNARRYGLALPTGYLPRLAAAARFALHVHRPDGVIPALSDSDGGSHLDTLALAGDVLDDDALRWAGTGGAEGAPPVERGVGFDVAGYYVQRSGWAHGAQERFLVLGAGPLGDGGHGHYDALSVEAFGRGRPLVVDPGRYTYAENAPGPDGPNWRHWFKGTAGHNTVTVDDLDQTPYRRGKPKGGTAFAHLVHRHTDPGRRGADRLDVLVAEVTSPAYEAVHRRHVLMVRGAWWLVVDECSGRLPHTYTLRWHLDAGAGRAALAARRGTASVVARGVGLAVAGSDGRGPAGTASVEPGWVSPSYGVRHAADVIAVRTGPARDVIFATVLVPRADATAPAPQLTAVAGGWCVEVDGVREVLTRDGDTWTLA